MKVFILYCKIFVKYMLKNKIRKKLETSFSIALTIIFYSTFYKNYRIKSYSLDSPTSTLGSEKKKNDSNLLTYNSNIVFSPAKVNLGKEVRSTPSPPPKALATLSNSALSSCLISGELSSFPDLFIKRKY